MQRVPAPTFSAVPNSATRSQSNSGVSIASLAAKYPPEQPLTKANIEAIYAEFKTKNPSASKDTFITKMCDYLKVGDRTEIFRHFDNNGQKITGGNVFKKSVSHHLAELAQEQFKAGIHPNRQEAKPSGSSSIYSDPYAAPAVSPFAKMTENPDQRGIPRSTPQVVQKADEKPSSKGHALDSSSQAKGLGRSEDDLRLSRITFIPIPTGVDSSSDAKDAHGSDRHDGPPQLSSSPALISDLDPSSDAKSLYGTDLSDRPPVLSSSPAPFIANERKLSPSPELLIMEEDKRGSESPSEHISSGSMSQRRVTRGEETALFGNPTERAPFLAAIEALGKGREAKKEE